MRYLIVSTAPKFDNRDCIVGYQSVQVHPYAFGTVGLALKMADKLQPEEPPEGFADDQYVEVWDTVEQRVVHPVYTSVVANTEWVPMDPNEIAF